MAATEPNPDLDFTVTDEDWQEIKESEFVDVVSGTPPGKSGFVFEHPEYGLHGLLFEPRDNELKAVDFEKDE